MTTATAPQLLGGLTPEAWDRIVGSSFHSTAAFLDLCAMHGGADPGAAVAYEDGEPVAVAPFAALTAPPTGLYRFNDLLSERGLAQLAPDGLLVGPRQGYRTQFPVVAGADRSAAIAELVGQLRDRSREAGDGACVAMYVPTSDAQALLGAGVTAQPVLLEADASFELPAGGWDAWIASLPSKRRVNVRREVRGFREAGYEIVRLPLSECIEQLPELIESTQSRYGHASPPAFWLGLLKMHLAAMGPAARVALCLRPGDSEPVGFCLYYVHADTLYLRWAGFDYSRLAGAAEYFNLMYYSHVALAPELGVRRLHAGIKTVEAKALRGAQLRPLWLVDLAEDSVLARDRAAVREHNAAAFERLAADSRTRPALGDGDAWRAFS